MSEVRTGGIVMRTYNLFRRKDRAELICAVPEDTPVPAFIRGRHGNLPEALMIRVSTH